MTDRQGDGMDEVEALLAAARAAPAAPPRGDLFARIIADAETTVAARSAAARSAAARSKAARPAAVAPKSLWSTLGESLGGWASLAGLATAALAGLWIGYADVSTLGPLRLGDLASIGTADPAEAYDLGDLMPDLAALEGES